MSNTTLNSPPKVSARLHVLFARESSAAVVVRRGPTRHTALIGWDRDSDTFNLGQWLYGRIYERRSDLSPDGVHLIYFAMNGRWSGPAKGAWTAVSRAPYLKANSLFAKGDCWHGGGLFESSERYWLNDGYGHDVLREDSRLERTTHYPWHETYGGECPGVYYVRLQRDGWTMIQTSSGMPSVFEKRINDRWTLRKSAHATSIRPRGRGVYFDTHELIDGRTGEALDKSDWEWAEVDGGRLVWATNGCLHSGRVGTNGLHGERLLHDFHEMQFTKLEAPY